MKYSDPDGRAAGDEFDSMDEAAIDWANTYADDSIFDMVELGSSIYSYERDGIKKYSYNIPQSGDQNNVNINRDVDDGQEIVSGIHSHGNYDPGYVKEEPSRMDRRGIASDSQRFQNYSDSEYLVTPRGYLKKFNQNGVTGVLRQDLVRDIGEDYFDLDINTPEYDRAFEEYNNYRDRNYNPDEYYE